MNYSGSRHMAIIINTQAYYGELYLRYLHKHGYPTADNRKAFNSKFYDEHKDRIFDHTRAAVAMSMFHTTIKVTF